MPNKNSILQVENNNQKSKLSILISEITGFFVEQKDGTNPEKIHLVLLKNGMKFELTEESYIYWYNLWKKAHATI